MLQESPLFHVRLGAPWDISRKFPANICFVIPLPCDESGKLYFTDKQYEDNSCIYKYITNCYYANTFKYTWNDMHVYHFVSIEVRYDVDIISQRASASVKRNLQYGKKSPVI